MSSASELSRPVKVDEIGGAPRTIRVLADEGERAALARRFGLIAIARLEGEAELRRDESAIVAEGRVAGEATQSCVATGDPLPVAVDAPFALRFVSAERSDAGADEVELSAADCDTIDYAGGAIDLGEAIAEEFALALDPFPRAQGADARLREAGITGEGESGPFAGLKGLLN